MTITELDGLIDEMTQVDYTREFGADDLPAEMDEAFGPAGWTEDLITEYESNLNSRSETPF